MSNLCGKTRRRWGVAIVFIVAAGGGTYGLLRHYEYPARFAVVDAGVLYRSSQPSARQIARLADEYGIRTLLIVRKADSERVTDEMRFAKKTGLNIEHIPIDSSRAITDQEVEQFFRCVDEPKNRPVLIHCSAGRHRTGYLCARYRIERQGWSVDRAIEELLSFGFNTKDQGVVLDQLKHFSPVRTTTTAALTGSATDAGATSR